MQNEQTNSKQVTPSWKVNLTQKFNKFYQNKNHINRSKLNFDDQLQLQLNYIPIQREQLSSNKKSQLFLKSQSNQLQYNKISDLKIKYQQQLNSNKKNQHYFNKTPIFDTSSVKQNNKIQKLNFLHLENQQAELNYQQQEEFSLLTNRKVANLIKDYFSQRQSIQIKQFIDVCCIQFFSKQPINTQLKSILIDQCRSLFCTTDQNFISLNALELATKKTELSIIINQKLLKAKYKKKKQALEKEYQGILEQILIQQQSIKDQNQKLSKRKKQIQTKQKQLLKKQKNLKQQEKQLIQKQKIMKKTIQDKNKKLIQQMSNQFQQLAKQLQKKSQTVERNARNKLQLLQKRLQDYKNYQSQHHYIPQKDNQQALNKKSQNELLLLKGKLRKVQKEFENYFTQKSKQMKNLQVQSNLLLKANTVLQNKLQKSKNKQKQLSQILAKKALELQQTRRELVQKSSKIQQLQSYTLELQQESKNDIKQNSKYLKGYKQKNQSKNKQRHFNKVKQLSRAQQVINIKQNQHNQCQKCEQIITKINKLLGLIIKGFDNKNINISNYQKQNINININSQSLKIQQILLNQSQSILLACADILWESINKKITQIQNIVSFMLKLFMAKFSFLKFQSINQSSILNNSSSIQEFIQNIHYHFNKNHSQSPQTKLKIYSNFILEFESNSIIVNSFNLNLIFTVLGIDEIYCLKKSKLQFIIHKIHSLVLKDILNSQTIPKNNLKVIQNLQDEQIMTFLFFKYMSYSTNQQQSFIFIDILVELCNYYSSTPNLTTIPLFKTILALQNYKNLFNFFLINFSQQNISNNNYRQMFEKISIILQRFCYINGNNIKIQESDLKRMKKIIKDLNKKNDFEYSLFKANMQNIIQKLSQDKI